MAKKNKVCISPNCVRVPVNRGLCSACYQAACTVVRDGRTTWEELATNGLAKNPFGLNPFTVAFRKLKAAQNQGGSDAGTATD